ncbi:Protein phosphatase PrpC [BD1-7 clade bacterium]|uniref:Protein phosphatase PrpC n=1 Tax=BD1-7 clade bacterium TaxID=2029982 RepID=A0A5S9PXY5_9GAMM|nr:Protein phosphatase PrpC [BD1-7 clade bacterium]
MAIPTPGFFGKLPMTGDFIHRRITPAFLNRWDEWLKHNLARSQQMLGSQWLDIYLTSPIWRFGISPGIIDDHAYCGVIVPSVDSVGRYFPLTISQAVPATAFCHMLSPAADQWYQSIEELMLDMLEGYHPDTDAFDQQLTTLNAAWVKDTGPFQQISMSELVNKSLHLQMTVSNDNGFAQATSSLLFSAMLGQQSPFSFWWQQNNDQSTSNCLMCANLPAGDQFAGLLDGSWKEHKWQTADLRGPKCPEPSRQIDELRQHHQEAQEPSPLPNSDYTEPHYLNRHSDAKQTTTESPYSTQTSNELWDITAPQHSDTVQPVTAKFDIENDPVECLEELSDSESDLVQLIRSDEDITISPAIDAQASRAKVLQRDISPGVYHPLPESAGFSDSGNYREWNEDSMLLMPSSGIFVVADGMGGHTDGAYASQAVVQAIESVDNTGSFEQVLERLRFSLDDVNQQLQDYAENHSEKNICGSTVAGLLLRGNQAAVFWAGDSRVYLVRDGALIPLSRDHSVEQEHIDAGIAKTAADFPAKNLITRAVGGDKQLTLDVFYHTPQLGDAFFLCSDGVYNETDETHLAKCIHDNNTAETAVNAIQTHLLKGPARDNLTGVLVLT